MSKLFKHQEKIYNRLLEMNVPDVWAEHLAANCDIKSELPLFFYGVAKWMISSKSFSWESTFEGFFFWNDLNDEFIDQKL